MPPQEENNRKKKKGEWGANAERAVATAGMRIVRLLVGRPPMTVAALIESTGVTRTAVTEQLNELVSAGFVERTTERLAGRGRPRHLYAATNRALLFLFSGNQRFLVPAMWQAMDEVGGEALKQKVLRRVSHTMAERYLEQVTGDTPQERLTQLSRLLTAEGLVVEVIEGEEGELVFQKRACEFYSMFEQSRSVCCIDEEMLQLILGTTVDRKSCRHDGDTCCSFTLSLRNGT